MNFRISGRTAYSGPESSGARVEVAKNTRSRLAGLFASIAFAGIYSAAGAAHAAEQLSWSYVTASVGSCVANVTCGVAGGTTSLGRETFVESDVFTSSASVNRGAGSGQAWASAQAGDGGLPVLKAYALGANPIPGPAPTVAVNYALAIGVQGYTNSSETPLVIPLNAFSGLVDYISVPGFGRVSASLAVTTNAILDPAVAALWWQSPTDVPGAFGRFSAGCGTPGALAIGNPAVASTTAAGVTQYLGVTTASCTGQANHVLNPGETFYVWSKLGVLRSGGGVTDAGQTFVVSITPEALDAVVDVLPSLTLASGANLNIPTDAAIPEPSTWALLIIGFGLTGSMVRRRRMTRV